MTAHSALHTSPPQLFWELSITPVLPEISLPPVLRVNSTEIAPSTVQILQDQVHQANHHFRHLIFQQNLKKTLLKEALLRFFTVITLPPLHKSTFPLPQMSLQSNVESW